MADEILKQVIKSDIEKVMKLLLTDDFDERQRFILKKWLLSLQHIDDVCKRRNRY